MTTHTQRFRSYGGFFGVEDNGVMVEQGSAVEGVPLIMYNNTIVCLNARTGEIADIYIVENDQRRCIVMSDVLSPQRSCMGLALHSNFGCNPAVGNWTQSKMEFGPGILRQQRYSLDKLITVDIEVNIPEQWSVVYKVTIRNNGNEPLKGDLVYNFLLKELHNYCIEPMFNHEHNATIHNIRTQESSYVVLRASKDIAHHLESLDFLPPDAVLPIPLSDSPLPLTYFNQVQSYHQVPITVSPGEEEEFRWVITYGRDEEETLRKASRSLSADPAKNTSDMGEYWRSKTSWLNCGNILTDSFVKYLLTLLEANCEPTGRVVCDLSGWGWGPASIDDPEWFDTMDASIALNDIPLCPSLTPEYFKKMFHYATDEKKRILKKDVIFRVGYEHYLRYPVTVYTHYNVTGDEKFLAESYDILKNSLTFLQENYTTEAGLLTIGVGYYDTFTVDGGMNEDGKSVFAYQQILACETLRAMADMAGILGKEGDAKSFLDWRKKLKEGLKTLWNDTYYSFTPEYDNYCVFTNMWAVILDLVDDDRKKEVTDHLLWTGMGFPQLHPPIPSDTWFRDGFLPYGSLQNGAMYADVLGLVASAANLTGNADLARKVFSVWHMFLTRFKYLLVAFNPWNPELSIGTYRSEIHSISSFLRSFFSGLAGLRRESRNFALRPLMIEEAGDLIEISSFPWGGSHFDIAVHGREAGLKSLLVDGKEVPSEIIPASFYDGKAHKIEAFSGSSDIPRLIGFGSGVYELEDINYHNETLVFSLEGFPGEETNIKVKTGNKCVKEILVNGATVNFDEKEGECSFGITAEKNMKVEIDFA